MVRIISLILILCNLGVTPAIANGRCVDGNPTTPIRGECTGR